MLSFEAFDPPLTGDSLMSAISAMKEKRPAIAEGLLYEQTINMIAAEPGIGKSTISTQIAIELAAGIPIFGLFHVPRPVKVFYAQIERPLIEILERIDIISKVYPIVKENLFVTDELQKLNLLIPEHVDRLLEYLKTYCPCGQVFFFDPIYPLVSGGLSSDLPASAFTKAMSLAQKETKGTFYYNHHNIKPQHDGSGQLIQKRDPFYGSQWLKAHATGYYHMAEHDNGVKLELKKDNYRLMPKTLILEYDAETGLSTVPGTETPALERVRTFLKAMASKDQTFTFNELQAATQLCTRVLRDIVMHSSISDMFIVISSSKNKHLYKSRL